MKLICSYETEPVLVPYPKNMRWMMFHEDWKFTINGVDYWVPGIWRGNLGYYYNGASIPRPAWSLLGITPTDPRIWAAAGAHDPLYSLHPVCRAVADEVLFQFARVPLADKRIIWGAVRVGAWWAWWNSKEDTRVINEMRNIIYMRPDSGKFDSLWLAKAA